MGVRLMPVAPAARKNPGLHFLVWHDIVVKKKLVWFDTTRAELEAQFERLENAGAKPIGLGDASQWLLHGRGNLPPGAVVLCFDDNTVGIHDHAFPILKRRNWPFVVSLHTAYVGVKTGKDHNDWNALRRMANSGAVLVSQTVNHPPDLRDLDAGRLDDEMRVSRSAMARQLGLAPFAVTYPSGKWDRRVAEVAANAGYVVGLTEDHGRAESSQHCLGIRRWSTHKRFDQAVAAIAKDARRRR